ncbi:MAG: AAA family ATPase [Oscillospiraceae bacterium]|nr:AAA family ATPase [Oscillospiraceae bacterium]
MLFYQVEAEIVGAREIIKDYNKMQADTENARKINNYTQTNEWKEFNALAPQYSEEFYHKYGREIYIFAAGIKRKTKILLGVFSRNEIDPAKIAVEFLKQIDAKFQNIEIREITFDSVHKLLDTSDRHDLVGDHSDILELFDLEELSNHYGRCIDYTEYILTDNTNKRTLMKKVNSLLCNETLVPEIERIYQAPTEAAGTGHPVHYMIQTDDPNVREQISTTLLSALYANKRVRSKRYCGIKLSPNRSFPDKYDTLYRSCFNTAIVVNYCGSDEDEDDYANPDIEIINGICSTLKKHRNNVLTIICLPRSCEKLKDLFIENLGTVTLIPLTEETVFGNKAKNYLRQLARAQNVTADKALYNAVSDIGKGYLAADLNIAFDEWYGKKLKTQVFPQYASFESASNQVAGRKPKGSAYSDLDKMIGLTKVKELISQAIDFQKAQRLFRDKGISSENVARHMVFTGNPGTAKTTAARLFAQIMKDNGLLSEGRLYEVGRADLVGKYVGWTAKIVKNKFQQARGSVLFIDEAYSLVDDKDGMYGDEAINTIVQEMENNREDMVVIFAGYPDKMEAFLQKNPGLRSRIAFHVPFEDYSLEELYQITGLLAEKKKIVLSPEVESKLMPIFNTHMKQEGFGNGRFARNLLEKAQMKQASRLVALDPSVVTKDDVLTLNADDFEIPELPQTQKKTIGFAQ